MNAKDFDALVDRARVRQDSILKTKGADYTRHEEDRLSNFKRSAAAVGIDPLAVWAIFINKHIDAVMAYVKTGKTESEAIQGRMDDIINYVYLGEALIDDIAREKGKRQTFSSGYAPAETLTATPKVLKSVVPQVVEDWR